MESSCQGSTAGLAAAGLVRQAPHVASGLRITSGSCRKVESSYLTQFAQALLRPSSRAWTDIVQYNPPPSPFEEAIVSFFPSPSILNQECLVLRISSVAPRRSFSNSPLFLLLLLEKDACDQKLFSFLSFFTPACDTIPRSFLVVFTFLVLSQTGASQGMDHQQ